MYYQDYIDYHKDIAIHLKDIAHTDAVKRFTRINIDEITNGLRTALDIKNICMSVEAYERVITDALSDNLRDIKNGAIMIFKYAKNDDFAAQDSVLSATEAACLKMVSKWKKDKAAKDALLKDLDFNSIKMYKIGPIFDSCFGWRVEFSFNESLNPKVKYNSSDWTY